MAVLGLVGPVRPARGPAPARLPARDRRSRARRSMSTGSRPVEPYAPRRRGPDGDRHQRTAPQPEPLGRPRGARPAAGDPAPLARDPDRRRPARRATCGSSRRSPTSGPPAKSSTPSCGRPGRWRRLAATTRSAPRRRSGTSPGSSRSSASQSALLADDRATFLARHLQTLIEAGDDPATADLDPGRGRGRGPDGPQGEGPRVPDRVTCRDWSPAGSRSRAGASRSGCRPRSSASRRRADGEVQLHEERRLFYVGMTRARDELVLSHAADYGGSGSRRVSPFVLEAIDLPPTAVDPAVRATDRARPDRRDRRAGPGADAAPPRPGRRAAHAVVLGDRRLPDAAR